jgi:hypothetical protein
MHVNCWSLPEEAVNGQQIKAPLQSGLRRAAENDLRNVILAHETCDSIGYVAASQSNYMCAKMLGKTKVLTHRPAVFRTHIPVRVYMDGVKISSEGLRHA